MDVKSYLLPQNAALFAEILQMSGLELLTYLKELSIENPVVDYEEKEAEDVKRISQAKEKLNWLDGSDEQNALYFNDDVDDGEQWRFADNDGVSLRQYLLEQLNALYIKREIYILAKYIIQNMDENGYIKESKEEFYDIFKPFKNIKPSYIDEAFKIAQSLEPAGIGAFDLSECLILQLKSKNIDNPLAESIIKNHLNDVAEKNVEKIAAALNTDCEQVISAIDIIKTLNPKPGAGFSAKDAKNYVIPDVIVKNGEVAINDYYLPVLGINNQYGLILNRDISQAAKEYITDRIRQAEWAIKCVQKRNETLLATAKALTETQKDFFTSAENKLLPVSAAEISKKIGAHESTVRRTIKNKYIQCFKGVFSLKYFFADFSDDE